MLLLRSKKQLFIHSFSAKGDLELHFNGTTTQWRQIQKLRYMARKGDLQQDHIRWIEKLQIEVVKLRDIRSINPEVVLPANPTAKAVAFHRLGSDLDRNFRQDLFGQIKVLKCVLPTLFIGSFA